MKYILFVLLLIATISCRSAPLMNDAAEKTVQRFQEAALDVVQFGGDWSRQDLQRRLKPVLDATHDLSGMLRIAMGSHWRGMTRRQLRQLLDAFRSYLVDDYAHRLVALNGEHFEMVGRQSLPAGRVRIDSLLPSRHGVPIGFTYILHRHAGHWRILNVFVDDLSLLAYRRAEFAGLLASSGPEALIRHMTSAADQH